MIHGENEVCAIAMRIANIPCSAALHRSWNKGRQSSMHRWGIVGLGRMTGCEKLPDIFGDLLQVRQLIGHDPELLARYDRSLLESYVEVCIRLCALVKRLPCTTITVAFYFLRKP